MALDVHRHPPRAEQGLLRLALMAAPQDGVHTGQQLPVGVWLGDVVVRTDLQTHDLVDLGILGGEHDDGNTGRAPNTTAHLRARQTREHEIEQHQVDRAGPAGPAGRLEALHGRGAVLGLHNLVAVAAQAEGERVPIVLLVLDQQDTGHAWSSSEIAAMAAKAAPAAPEATAAAASGSGPALAWSGWSGISRGRTRVKVEPRPGVDHNSTVPP